MNLKDFKVMAWAMHIADEYDCVPDVDKIDDVCDIFGDGARDWYVLAMTKYCGYSHLDISSLLGRSLRNVEISIDN